jgi:hypothetical protein
MQLVHLQKKVVLKTQSVREPNVSAKWDILTEIHLVGIQRKL